MYSIVSLRPYAQHHKPRPKDEALVQVVGSHKGKYKTNRKTFAIKIKGVPPFLHTLSRVRRNPLSQAVRAYEPEALNPQKPSERTPNPETKDKAAPLVMAACEDRVEVTRALIKGKAARCSLDFWWVRV